MIGMAMSDEHVIEPGPAGTQGLTERGKVVWMADPGVDQGGTVTAIGQQIGIVALTGHRTGIPRGQQERLEHDQKL
jgi:hypothetical protein